MMGCRMTDLVKSKAEGTLTSFLLRRDFRPACVRYAEQALKLARLYQIRSLEELALQYLSRARGDVG